MGPVLALPVAPQAAIAAPALDAADQALVEFLRACARSAQLAEAFQPHRACPLTEDDAAAYGRALLRALGAVSSRPVVFHPRRTPVASFDERWALRLVRALQAGDDASAAVLIGGRTAQGGRRVLAWLARGLAERIARDGVDAARHTLDLRMVPSSEADASDAQHRRPA